MVLNGQVEVYHAQGAPEAVQTSSIGTKPGRRGSQRIRPLGIPRAFRFEVLKDCAGLRRRVGVAVQDATKSISMSYLCSLLIPPRHLTFQTFMCLAVIDPMLPRYLSSLPLAMPSVPDAGCFYSAQAPIELHVTCLSGDRLYSQL